MSLLQQIQESAIQSGSDLGELLRRCKLLAARLGNKPLDDWLLWEANGYPEDAELPSYRTFPASLQADFNGPFGRHQHHVPVPLGALPDFARKLGTYQCRESVSDLGEWSTKAAENTDRLTVSLTDFMFLLQDAMPGYGCVGFRGHISAGRFRTVLGVVRERVLDFSLELEKLDPRAGEVAGTAPPPAEVQQVVQATIYGGSTVVGSAPDSILNTKNIEMAGDTYTNSGQVAAMGRGASASGNTLQQVMQGVDLNALAGELRELAGAMRKEAGDAELVASAGLVEAAAVAAEQGDGEQAAWYLAKAGPRAFAFCEKVGASVAGGTALHLIKQLFSADG